MICPESPFPAQPYFLSKSDLYKSFQTDSDTQMYLSSSALIFFIDRDFSLGHMSMDLSSVLAALSSPMVPSVSGIINQVVSPHSCLAGLAGPEPSGPLINPGPHLQPRVRCGVPKHCHHDDIYVTHAGRQVVFAIAVRSLS